MSEQVKHTPGEWVVGADGFGVETERGELIADTATGPFDDAVCRANASVLAAAPDLFAALEAVEWVQIAMPGHPGFFIATKCPWCRQGKDSGHTPDCPRQLALAKARGE